MAPSAVAVNTFDVLTEGQIADVRAGLEDVTRADGVGPLSEDTRLHLVSKPTGATHLVVTGPDGNGISGYAQLDRTASFEQPTVDPGAAELFVVPEHRGHQIGTALLRALLELCPNLSVWAHGDQPAAQHLAERLGLARTRELWQMRRPLDTPLPDPALPPDVAVRTFRVGSDEQTWLDLNARAFASHPEQGSWTIEDLRLRESEPWFEPAGFFLAERGGSSPQLVGFHWTKVHPGAAGSPPIGEVYVLGVAPGQGGHGLGSALTLVGLRHLQGLGLTEAMLYVDADNPAAVAVYTRLGFQRWGVDVTYQHG